MFATKWFLQCKINELRRKNELLKQTYEAQFDLCLEIEARHKKRIHELEAENSFLRLSK